MIILTKKRIYIILIFILFSTFTEIGGINKNLIKTLENINEECLKI